MQDHCFVTCPNATAAVCRVEPDPVSDVAVVPLVQSAFPIASPPPRPGQKTRPSVIGMTLLHGPLVRRAAFPTGESKPPGVASHRRGVLQFGVAAGAF